MIIITNCPFQVSVLIFVFSSVDWIRTVDLWRRKRTDSQPLPQILLFLAVSLRKTQLHLQKNMVQISQTTKCPMKHVLLRVYDREHLHFERFTLFEGNKFYVLIHCELKLQSQKCLKGQCDVFQSNNSILQSYLKPFPTEERFL